MSRTLSAALASHLGTRSHSRCNMLLLELRDGTTHGFTDHDKDIAFSLPEKPGTVTYSARAGLRFSDISLPSGLDVGNCEVTGPIGEVFTLAGVLGGRWNRATAWVFQVNWKAPTASIDLMKGKLSELRPAGGEFTVEIRDDRDALNQVVCSVITPYCKGEHAACCVQIAPSTATTITSVESALQFNIAAALNAANHLYGKVQFTTGALAGTLPVEIFSISGSTVKLFEPLVAAPGIGDALTVKEGCDRTRATCKARFNNVLEFRGYPEVPGSDQVLRSAIEGA